MSIKRPSTQLDRVDWQSLSKINRIQELHTLDEEVPKSYEENDIREDVVLEYVAHFEKQYTQLYPNRKKLLLSPLNEYGVNKFISTTIVPSQLPYPDIYDYDKCATFVSNYITFEKLLEPTRLPNVVCSPSTTLKMQIGDCFDMAVLLVSLLKGVGYNAFCVSGYASNRVTTMHTQAKKCPIVVSDKVKTQEELILDEKENPKSKYKLKNRLQLRSNFDKQKQEEEERKRAENKNTNDSPIDAIHEEDQLHGKRVHAWVLVLPDNRNVKTPFFLEPSTGERVDITNNDYLGIESIWNTENYWVNVQDVPCGELKFDIFNLHNWEYIFVLDETDEEDNENHKKPILQPGNESGEYDEEVLDLPISWVQKLQLSKEAFASKYPGKEKVTEYRDAELFLYAPYHREDCLVKHIVFYEDEDKFNVREEHFFFANRKDKLIRRSFYKRINVTHEWFAPGRRQSTSIEGLKEIIREENVKHQYNFYGDARLDGLESRIELFDKSTDQYPQKIIHTFKNRSDFLSYRSVRYDTEIPAQPFSKGNQNTPAEERPIVKMTEKYERNHSKSAHDDVQKRVFYVLDGRIKLVYHYAKNQITHSVREYTKRGEFSIDIVDPFQKRPKLSETIEEFSELSVAEKQCHAQINSYNDEMEKILDRREKEEQSVEYTTTIYDTLLNRPSPEEIAELERLERERLEKLRRKDILGSFLEENETVKDEAHARRIFQAACAKLRERLLARTKIMEERLQEERKYMNRKRTAYQKTQDAGDKNEEEFVKFWEEMMFRMSILRKRTERNKREAKREYAQLQEQLLDHPKLRDFLQRDKKKYYESKKKITDKL